MQIDIALTINDIKMENICLKTVIVIDTLRATTTILSALKQGCKKVIPVETLGQALAYSTHEDTLLIGERYSKKVKGFDLPNSPSQIEGHHFSNKTIVISSSNGTKALQKVRKAPLVLVGCMRNASCCVEKALKAKRDILLVCAGRQGEFAIEDGLTAGVMIQLIQQKQPDYTCSELALILALNHPLTPAEVYTAVCHSETYRRLIKTGQQDDIAFCLAQDEWGINGVYGEDGIVLSE